MLNDPPVNLQAFAEMQLVTKRINVDYTIDHELRKVCGLLPKVPYPLLETMAEVRLDYALQGFTATDDRGRRITGLNYEPHYNADFTHYMPEYAVEAVLRPIFGGRTAPKGIRQNVLYETSKRLTSRGRFDG
eukprot:4706553-Amphidinium_carterae.1